MPAVLFLIPVIKIRAIRFSFDLAKIDREGQLHPMIKDKGGNGLSIVCDSLPYVIFSKCDLPDGMANDQGEKA